MLKTFVLDCLTDQKTVLSLSHSFHKTVFTCSWWQSLLTLFLMGPWAVHLCVLKRSLMVKWEIVTEKQPIKIRNKAIIFISLQHWLSGSSFYATMSPDRWRETVWKFNLHDHWAWGLRGHIHVTLTFSHDGWWWLMHRWQLKKLNTWDFGSSSETQDALWMRSKASSRTS